MTPLRIALRNYADFENALSEQVTLFESRHPGVKVELTSVGIHELHQAALQEGGLHNGKFDLALLVTDWLAEGMASGALEDLHRWHGRDPLPDWPDGWAKSLVRPLVFGDQLSSIPWHDGPECLVYRSDLFHDSTVQEEFLRSHGRPLAPPTNWEEFEVVARFFTGRSKGLYGTVFAAFPDGHNTLYDFALQLWSRGGEMLDERGCPRLNSQQAIDAFDYYRRLVRDPAVCHPKSMELDSTQSGDLFLNGEVAMMVNWFGFAARSSREASPLAGKVAIAAIPANPGIPPVSLSVFWALAMGSGSKNKELAWEFLRFVAAPEQDLNITRHGTVGVRLSTWRDPELQRKIPAYSEIEQISLNARQLPIGPHMAEFASIIDSVVTRTLRSDVPTAVILESAQNEIDAKGLRFP